MNHSSDGENFSVATLVMATETVAAEVTPEVAKRVAVAKTIKRLVSAEAGITVEEMISPSRQVRVAHPRQLAMYLIRVFSMYSTPQIGRMFGDRDHTTVLWAVARVEARLKHDPKLAAAVGRISDRIAQETGLTPESVEATRSLGEKLARLHLKVYCDLPGATGVTN